MNICVLCVLYRYFVLGCILYKDLYREIDSVFLGYKNRGFLIYLRDVLRK